MGTLCGTCTDCANAPEDKRKRMLKMHSTGEGCLDGCSIDAHAMTWSSGGLAPHIPPSTSDESGYDKLRRALSDKESPLAKVMAKLKRELAVALTLTESRAKGSQPNRYEFKVHAADGRELSTAALCDAAAGWPEGSAGPALVRALDVNSVAFEVFGCHDESASHAE